VWDTACRKIVDEFGDTAAYSTPMSDCSGFIVVGQPCLSVAAPYLITYVQLLDDGSVGRVQVLCAHAVKSTP